jgi:parallel beta-helix repeat protein
MGENKYIKDLDALTDATVADGDLIVLEDVSVGKTKALAYKYVKHQAVDPCGTYGLSTTNSGADNATAFAAMIAGMSSGSCVVIPTGSYTMAGNITISKACTILGCGATFTWASDTTAKRGLLITASNVEIEGITLDGPQHAASISTQIGIYAYGADSSNYITGLKINHCEITDWTWGIVCVFVKNFDVSNNHIYDCYSVGVSMQSSSYGTVSGNQIKGLAGTRPCYGIALTKSNGNLVDYPRSSDIVVSNNVIDGVADWDGLNTHGGQRCHFVHNTVINCIFGIDIGGASDAGGNKIYPALDIIVDNNIVESGVTDGSAYQAISFTGIDATTWSTGQITNNRLIGHAREALATDGGIVAYFTSGLDIRGNYIKECATSGIHLYQYNYDFSVTNNTIVDVWSNTTTTIGIRENSYNTGYIGQNKIYKDSKSATYVNTYGIYLNDQVGDLIVIGDNYIEADYHIGGDIRYAVFGTVNGGSFVMKDVFNYTDFASSTAHYFVPNLHDGFVITDAWWYLNTEFAGGSVSAATLQFGVATVDEDGLFPAENVFTGAGTGYKDSDVTSRGALLYSAGKLEYFVTEERALRATIVLTGDTGDHLTAGQATLWIKGYKVK